MTTFEDAYERLIGCPAPPVQNPQLQHYWNLPVSQLCELDDPPLAPEVQERHRIYSYLLMAITWNYWNGYKLGHPGIYPWNDVPGPTDPSWLSGDYRGHNIAALAVDATGRILDFDFNHNTLFNSSAEHAEARLVRRLYSLAQISDAWSAAPSGAAALGSAASSGGYTSLSSVTIYTSLESCAQCSGIMALATVKDIVYLQTDPGTYFIGRILRNLTTPGFQAPLPISGCEIGVAEFAMLNAAFDEFVQAVPTKPFWISADGSSKNVSPAITSFLCTDIARSIFAEGGVKFSDFSNGTDPLSFPTFNPNPTDPNSLTNLQVLADAVGFQKYAVTLGLRGTPHTL